MKEHEAESGGKIGENHGLGNWVWFVERKIKVKVKYLITSQTILYFAIQE